MLLEKGAGAEERKRAEALIAFTAAARAFYAAALGPAPDVPVRLVAVRRGAGFSDSWHSAHSMPTRCVCQRSMRRLRSLWRKRSRRLWIGGQTPVRGEGGGVLRDALVRFLATEFLEKQFGPDAVKSELYRQRLAYATVAQRDGPLARTTPAGQHLFRFSAESWRDVLASG